MSLFLFSIAILCNSTGFGNVGTSASALSKQTNKQAKLWSIYNFLNHFLEKVQVNADATCFFCCFESQCTRTVCTMPPYGFPLLTVLHACNRCITLGLHLFLPIFCHLQTVSRKRYLGIIKIASRKLLHNRWRHNTKAMVQVEMWRPCKAMEDTTIGMGLRRHSFL